jgi:hypothetical protein
MLQEEVKFVVKGHEYTIKYPTVGQYYNIEALKQSLGRGNYNMMLQSPLRSVQDALDMIDIEATLTIMCPDLIKDLKVPITELDVRDFVAVKDAYIKQVAPFFKSINDALHGDAGISENVG